MVDLNAHRTRAGHSLIKLALLCLVVFVVALDVTACQHTDGITVNIVNPGPYNYTQLTFDHQPVNFDGTLSANTSAKVTGVMSGSYQIATFYGSGLFAVLDVTVYGTDNEDTWTGPGSGGGNGTWSSK